MGGYIATAFKNHPKEANKYLCLFSSMKRSIGIEGDSGRGCLSANEIIWHESAMQIFYALNFSKSLKGDTVSMSTKLRRSYANTFFSYLKNQPQWCVDLRCSYKKPKQTN